MRTRRAVAAWLASVTLAACSGGTDSPAANPPLTTGAIRISNASTHAFDRVYAGPSPVEVFSAPRNGAPIAPGASITLDGLLADTWDVLVSTGSGDAIFSAHAFDLPLDAGETVALSFTDADFSGRFRVTNDGASEVTAIYVGSTSNVLDVPLAPGASIVPAWGFGPATYQVRCEHGLDAPYTGSLVITSLVIAPFTCL